MVRVSIFQKSLQDGLGPAAFKKLAGLKSDFLLLPEYFYADATIKDHKELAERGQFALDWLLKISDSYKGIIIGGSIALKEKDLYYNAMPVIADGVVVDWYRKRNLTEHEAKLLTPGKDPGIFILKGFRFGTLICADVFKREYYDELAKSDVHLIFTVMNSPKREETADDKHARDEELFLKPARENRQYIAKCCSTGTIFNRPLQGRSLVATPTGISWRVSPQEEGQEILKTVLINVAGKEILPAGERTA